jgi:hypothetical protein
MAVHPPLFDRKRGYNIVEGYDPTRQSLSLLVSCGYKQRRHRGVAAVLLAKGSHLRFGSAKCLADREVGPVRTVTRYAGRRAAASFSQDGSQPVETIQ